MTGVGSPAAHEGSRFAGLVAAVAVLCAAAVAAASEHDVIVLPTAVVSPAPPGRLRRPDLDERLERARRQLDLVLGEAIQDLGLTLDLSQRPKGEGPRGEAELVARATNTWVLSPEIALDRGEIDLKLTAVAPGSSVVLVRRERVSFDDLDLKAMKMLRDLVQAGQQEPATAPPPLSLPVVGAPATRAQSPGRAVLALNGAAFGGYVGYSVQRASGSRDVRLTYPLTALGTGVGLGASLIVSDEWDIGVGDAWYLAAGMWWPGVGTLLLADGYNVVPVEDRFLYGMLGAASGLTLATTSLALGHVDAGGASLTHSGGIFGALLGGIAEAYVDGDLTDNPTRGMGYGAMGGVVLAGVAATQIEVTPSRVLFIDLVAGLGSLVGAAVASPLIVGEEATDGETRGWLASVAAGTLAGATVGTLVTRPRVDRTGQRPRAWAALPYGGMVAEPLGPADPPPMGIGIQGSW